MSWEYISQKLIGSSITTSKMKLTSFLEDNVRKDKLYYILLVHSCYVTILIIVYYRIKRRPWKEDVDGGEVLNRTEESGWKS